MVERVISRGEKIWRSDPWKAQEIICVAPVALVVPDGAGDYGLKYEEDKPFFVLNHYDNGQPCSVGEIIERSGGILFKRISERRLDQLVIPGNPSYVEIDSRLGGWAAIIEPIGEEDIYSGDELQVEKARIKAIRAFCSFQRISGDPVVSHSKELREGLLIAPLDTKLYPICGVSLHPRPVPGSWYQPEPRYKFSIEENGQVRFDPVVG